MGAMSSEQWASSGYWVLCDFVVCHLRLRDASLRASDLGSVPRQEVVHRLLVRQQRYRWKHAIRIWGTGRGRGGGETRHLLNKLLGEVHTISGAEDNIGHTPADILSRPSQAYATKGKQRGPSVPAVRKMTFLGWSPKPSITRSGTCSSG